jgi:hypothetical protein
VRDIVCTLGLRFHHTDRVAPVVAVVDDDDDDADSEGGCASARSPA